MKLRRLLSTLLALLFLGGEAAAQTQHPAPAPSVTASATSSGVRFAALGAVRATRLEVYDAAGSTVFDSGFLPGNVRDWAARDAGLADGAYTCVLTSRELSGRLSIKQAAVLLRAGEASLALGAADAAGEAGRDQTAAPPAGDEAGAATLSTHDGRDGALTSTSGAITLRTGDVLRGEEKERMRVTPDGRVGIGTAAPEAALDVAGAVRASGGFKFPDGTTLSARGGRLTLTDEAGDELPGPSAAAGSGTVNRLAKWAETGGAGTLTDAAGAESGGLTFFGQNSAGQVAPLFPGAATFHVLEVGAAGTKTPLTLAGGSGSMEFWRDLGGGNGAPSAAVAFGMAKPGGAASNDMVFSTYTAAAGWNERARITSAGNFGVGTGSPQARLDVNGGARLAPGGTGGEITFGVPNAETGMTISNAGTRADLRFNGSTVKLVAGPAGGPPPSASGVSVTTTGRVGIGIESPTTGRLHVVGGDALPAVYAEGPNRGVWGKSTGGSYGLYGESVSGIGAQGVSTSNIGVSGLSTSNVAVSGGSGSGIGVRGETASTSVTSPGVQGVSTGAGGVGVRGDGTTGVYGVSEGGVGVTGESLTGVAVYAKGNAGQARDRGGFVKAMLYVNPLLPADQYIVRCYNGVTNSSSGTCGFSVVRGTIGSYHINFNFQVNDRYVSLTPQSASMVNIGASFHFHNDNSNRIYVSTFITDADELNSEADNPFMIIVY